jgi:hypothetical protein
MVPALVPTVIADIALAIGFFPQLPYAIGERTDEISKAFGAWVCLGDHLEYVGIVARFSSRVVVDEGHVTERLGMIETG